MDKVRMWEKIWMPKFIEDYRFSQRIRQLCLTSLKGIEMALAHS